MANRWFNQFRNQLEKSVVDLFARVTFGSTGAPTLDTANSKGFKSITRNSAGKYTIVLQDTYSKILNVDFFQVVGAGAPAAINTYLVSDGVGTSGNPNFVVQYANGSGTATDPASGEEVRFNISLRNSTAV